MAFSYQMTLAFGLHRKTVVRLDAEVEAARAEREARCVSPSCFSLFVSFCIYDVNVMGAFRAKRAARHARHDPHLDHAQPDRVTPGTRASS
jgi:hypothetical protein